MFAEYKIPVPAIQGFFGSRLMTYATQATPQQLLALLGHDPRSTKRRQLKASSPETAQIYDQVQRPTNKGRRDSVAAYIAERMTASSNMIGGFPAVSIGCTHPEDFEPTGEGKALGMLLLDAAISGPNRRIMLDGLGRLTGALERAEAGHSDATNFKFPITFYCPRPGDTLTIGELGQLFADFNGRVHPVPARFSLRLEQVDRYVRLSRALYDEPFLAEHGGVAEGAASLGGKSNDLVAQTVFVRAVRGACEGRRFQDTGEHLPDDPTLTDGSFNVMQESIGAFFNTIAEYMGDERWQQREGVHLTSPGWQALGVLHHDLVVRQLVADPHKAAKKIAALDWSRFNEAWLEIGLGTPETDKETGAVIVDNKGRKKVALTNRGRTSVDVILQYVRNQLGIAADAVTEEVQAA